jgi:hypothetical protein
VTRTLRAMAVAAVLTMPALASGERGGAVRETTQTCSCTVCGQPVCCKALTGFAPLDEKCKRPVRYNVANGGTSCGST